MTKEEIIRNLKYTMEKHKNDTVNTFRTNISAMCKDILDYLEQEPKIGHWIGRDASGTNFYGKCSCCGQEIQINAWYTQNMNYCPNCGAKMESEGKE